MFGVAMINKLHKDRSWLALVLLLLDLARVLYFLLIRWKHFLWEQLMQSRQELVLPVARF